MIQVNLPSQPFLEEYMTVVGWEVKQTRSTPYFLLFIVFKQLQGRKRKHKQSYNSRNNKLEKY